MAVGGKRGVRDKGSGRRKHRQDSPREALKPLRFPGFTCFPHRGCWYFRALAHEDGTFICESPQPPLVQVWPQGVTAVAAPGSRSWWADCGLPAAPRCVVQGPDLESVYEVRPALCVPVPVAILLRFFGFSTFELVSTKCSKQRLKKEGL